MSKFKGQTRVETMASEAVVQKALSSAEGIVIHGPLTSDRLSYPKPARLSSSRASVAYIRAQRHVSPIVGTAILLFGVYTLVVSSAHEQHDHPRIAQTMRPPVWNE